MRVVTVDDGRAFGFGELTLVFVPDLEQYVKEKVMIDQRRLWVRKYVE